MIFTVTQKRAGKIIATRSAHNLVTVEALVSMAAILFHDFHTFYSFAPPVDSPQPVKLTDRWFAGLIDSGSVVKGDTAASHGFNEFTDYKLENTGDLVLRGRGGGVGILPVLGSTDGIRFIDQTQPPVLNASVMTAVATIVGAFWISDDTKGGGAGVLWGGANFALPIDVRIDDILSVTYELTAQANDSLGAP